MTDASDNRPTLHAHLPEGLGLKEFVVLMSALIAMTALSIDTMLPALPDIGHSLAIANANDRQLIISVFFLGLAGGNFAIFSLWLPEQYNTQMRATAFAFCTSFGRFLGAGANFAIAALVAWTGSLGYAVALTAIPFLLGLTIIPFAHETRGEALP